MTEINGIVIDENKLAFKLSSDEEARLKEFFTGNSTVSNEVRKLLKLNDFIEIREKWLFFYLSNEESTLTKFYLKTGVDFLKYYYGRITEHCFQCCDYLIEIKTPLTDMKTWSFAYCANLKSITISNKITYIPKAFVHCSIKEINYEGTKKEWLYTSKALDWNEDSHIEVIHCSDGDIKINK